MDQWECFATALHGFCEIQMFARMHSAKVLPKPLGVVLFRHSKFALLPQSCHRLRRLLRPCSYICATRFNWIVAAVTFHGLRYLIVKSRHRSVQVRASGFLAALLLGVPSSGLSWHSGRMMRQFLTRIPLGVLLIRIYSGPCKDQELKNFQPEKSNRFLEHCQGSVGFMRDKNVFCF